MNIIDRLMSRVITPLGDDNCWTTDLTPDRDGYVRIGKEQARANGTTGQFRAHRFMWEAYNAEPIPTGCVVMHSCDNPGCINPNHLSVGTHKQNMEDCARKGRNWHGPRPGFRPRKYDRKAIAEYRASNPGLTMKQVAAHFGCSVAVVDRSVREHKSAG